MEAAPGVKVDLREVERYILDKHEQFGIESVNIDQYQAELLSQRLTNAGACVNTIAFTAAACCDMAATALAAFNDSRVQLHRNKQLVDDLKRCTVKETNVGARIEIKRKSGRGHGDALVSFLLALLAARDAVEPLGDDLLDDDDGPLIWN